MKRLSSVFLLAAAMVLIVGCGTKSKKNETKVDFPTYTLPLGNYFGDQGLEYYKLGVTREKINELKLARSGKALIGSFERGLKQELANLKKKFEDLSLVGRQKAKLEEQIEAKEKELAAMAKNIESLNQAELEKIVKGKLVSMGFTIAKEKESGRYVMNDLVFSEKIDGLVREEKLSKNVYISFDYKSGKVTFRQTVSDDTFYQLDGRVSLEIVDKKIQHVISGLISQHKVDEPHVAYTSIRAVLMTPVVGKEEKPKVEDKIESPSEEGQKEEPKAVEPKTEGETKNGALEEDKESDTFVASIKQYDGLQTEVVGILIALRGKADHQMVNTEDENSKAKDALRNIISAVDGLGSRVSRLDDVIRLIIRADAAKKEQAHDLIKEINSEMQKIADFLKEKMNEISEKDINIEDASIQGRLSRYTGILSDARNELIKLIESK